MQLAEKNCKHFSQRLQALAFCCVLRSLSDFKLNFTLIISISSAIINRPMLLFGCWAFVCAHRTSGCEVWNLKFLYTFYFISFFRGWALAREFRQQAMNNNAWASCERWGKQLETSLKLNLICKIVVIESIFAISTHNRWCTLAESVGQHGIGSQNLLTTNAC